MTMPNPTTTSATTTGASPATAAKQSTPEKTDNAPELPPTNAAMQSLKKRDLIDWYAETPQRAAYVLRKLVAISIVSEDLLHRLRDETARIAK